MSGAWPSALLETSWTRAWSDVGLRPPAGSGAALVAAYQASQRHYHTLEHLQECFMHFETARHLAADPGELALALWFHDAVYEVRGQDNEQRSADWATQVLAAAQASPATQDRVVRLILATRHEGVPTGADEPLLVDIDLAILGAPPPRFAEYSRQVRAEYSWVPDAVYKEKRRAVLRGFLSRPSIYNTEFFRERYERQARGNLSAVV